MRRWLLIACAVAGCKKSAAPDEGIAPVDPNRPKEIPAAELKRGDDACQALAKRACDCGSASEACHFAQGQLDAVQISLELAHSATATHRDILQAQDSIRKTYAHCIEESTKPTPPCR